MSCDERKEWKNDITTLFHAVDKLSKKVDVMKQQQDAADKTLSALEKTDDDLCTDLTELSSAVTHLRTDIGETQSWCEAQDESIKRLAERCADADDVAKGGGGMSESKGERYEWRVVDDANGMQCHDTYYLNHRLALANLELLRARWPEGMFHLERRVPGEWERIGEK